MAKVYQAEDTESNGRLVAVKCPWSRNGSLSGEDLLRFKREWLALKVLTDQPHIMRLIDAKLIGSESWMVLAWHEKSLAGRKMDVEGARSVVMGILEGLEFPHSESMVHRDLKPDNIRLDEQERPVIGDWGLVKIHRNKENETALRKLVGDADVDQVFEGPYVLTDFVSGMTGTGVYGGTPGYRAPEQLEDFQHVDHRADLFSVGMILYTLLTGKGPPVDLGGLDSTMASRLQHSSLPEYAVSIIRKAVAVNPDGRYKSSSDFRKDLQDRTAHSTTLSRGTYTVQIPGRPPEEKVLDCDLEMEAHPTRSSGSQANWEHASAGQDGWRLPTELEWRIAAFGIPKGSRNSGALDRTATWKGPTGCVFDPRAYEWCGDKVDRLIQAGTAQGNNEEAAVARPLRKALSIMPPCSVLALPEDLNPADFKYPLWYRRCRPARSTHREA